MLPSLGFQEIVLLCVIALVVVGPKDLPLMLRKLGRWTTKLRAMANEFRSGMDELARQAELDELKKEVEALRRDNPIREITQPLREIEREVNRPLPAPAPAPVVPHDVAHGAPQLAKPDEAPAAEADEADAQEETPVVDEGAKPLARSAP